MVRKGSKHGQTGLPTKITKLGHTRSVVLAIGLAVALAIVIGTLLVVLERREREQRAWVEHTNEVIATLQAINLKTTAVESAVRGFRLNGTQENLEPYYAASREIEILLTRLQSLISDNLEQLPTAAEVTRLVREKFALSKAMAEAALRGVNSAANGAGYTLSPGTVLMQKIQDSLDTMSARELLLLKERQLRADQARQQTQVAIVGILLLVLMLTLVSARMILQRERERVRAQLSIEKSEARYRLLADNSTDIIVHRDFATGAAIYFSPSTIEILGRQPQTLLGYQWLDYVHPDDRALVNETHSAPGSGKSLEGQFRVLHRDGHYIWVEKHGRFIEGTDVHGASLQSTWRDVTERRKAEEQAIQLKEDAIRAREDADKANKAKSDFLAMMSHELRTPMTGVLGIADLLLMGEPEVSEQRRLTKQLKRSALSLLDILNDILDFSKIEAGKLEIEHSAFSLGDVVTDIRGLFGPVASAKGIVFDVVTVEDLPDALIGDANRLRQVIVNLVNNAVKFTHAGQVELRLSYQDRGPMTVDLHGAVSDTGIGMTESVLEKLFRPFSQADSSTSRKFGGTGLGLTIVRLLISAMRGTLAVESRKDHGSTFSFVLPLERAAASLLTPMRPERRGKEPRTLRPLRLLLAEDTETVRQVVTVMLTRMGHAVDAVENGNEAVAKVQGNVYDAVLMDMQMPVMDGLEATKLIRHLDGPDFRVPIIALTADAIFEHREKYMNGGVDAIVTKPITWDVLIATLARLVPEVAVPPVVDRRESHTKGTGPILNERLIGDLVEAMGAEALAPFMRSFSASIARYRSDLLSACNTDNLKSAKRTAHALKGLASQLGADQLAAAAAFIEIEAASTEAVTTHMPTLTQAINDTMAEFAARYEWAKVS